MGWGGSGGKLGSDLRTKYMEGRERDRLGNRSAFLLLRSTAFGGLPESAHPPRKGRVALFAEALSRFIRPPETAFESVYCETHSSNLDKILTVY